MQRAAGACRCPSVRSSSSPPPGFRLPAADRRRRRRPRPPDEILEQQSRRSYYDTDDLRLARAGASLRYRSVDGWTVKLPAPAIGAAARARLSTHSRVTSGLPPDRGGRPRHRAECAAQPLQPIAKLRTSRRRIALVDDAGGKPVAEVVDDEVSVLDGAAPRRPLPRARGRARRRRARRLADALVARLQAAGAGPADPTPQDRARARVRARSTPPDVAPRRPSAATPPPATSCTRAIAAVGRCGSSRHDPGVRLGDDPEDVHQARVATRRLRSDLRTFRSLLDAEWDDDAARRAAVARRRARRGPRHRGARSSASGAQVERWLADADRADAEPLLDQPASSAGRRAGPSCSPRCAAHRYVQLLDRLVDAARDAGAAPGGGRAAPRRAARRSCAGPWRQLRGAVEALDDEPADEALHEVRIRAKRCRYAAEAVAPVVGKPARRFARADRRRAGRARRAPGRGRRRTLAPRPSPAPPTPARGFVAGELTALERDAAARARDEWPDVWRDARRKRLRGWL